MKAKKDVVCFMYKAQFTEQQLRSRPELFAFVKRMAYNCVEYDYFDRENGWHNMPCNLEMFMLHAEYDQAFDLYNIIYKNKNVKEYMLVNFVVENAFLLNIPEIDAEMDEAYSDKQSI